MRYSNDSLDAMLELEKQKTGDYGYDHECYEDDRADDMTDEWLYERDDD